VSEVAALLAEAADDFFRRECPTEKAGTADPELVARFARAGLMEEAGLEDAAIVVSAAARYGAQLPLIEDWLATQPEADRRRLGAVLSCAQIAGALERALQFTVEHVTTRQQFGVPIVRFQAVAHQLAQLAEETAAARAAADGASADSQEWKVAAAKVRCGEAAAKGAEIAHQLHGAIGFTNEHALRHFSAILWQARDRFGTETEWAIQLGRHVAASGDPWRLLTESV